MHFTLPPPSRSIAGLLFGVSLQAMAAGFGPGPSSIMLGQTLDFAVPVRLDSGADLSSGCVSAEVVSGERRLAHAAVRAFADVGTGEGARVRVQTTVIIDEPVVQVTVSLRCGTQLTRRFVVFAEPPGFAAAAPPPQALAPVTVPPAASASPPPPPPASSVGGVRRTDDAAPSAVAAAPGEGASAPRARVAPARPPASTAAEARPERAAARKQRPRPRRAERREALPTAEVQAAAPARAGPRLRLEAVPPAPAASQPDAVAAALQAVAEAASAAEAAAAAASAAAVRIAQLERTVEQMRAEARSQGELAAQLRDRLAASESQSQWVWPLVVLALALGAVAGWLGWRLRVAQSAQVAEWRRVVPPMPAQAGKATTAPIPFVTADTLAAATLPAAPPARAAAAWPPPAATVADPWAGAVGDTQPVMTPSTTEPATGFGHSSLSPLSLDEVEPRDVTIEELIDLEQQAEFFVVLGQDEAAIDLLVDHLRSTGGGSPLPYLKLLEIYGRRGDREAYERTRARFNRRFNAYAPEWGADLGAGRSLEDYAGVIPRLQQIWGKPLDAMAELESLLFRRQRGEMFDLPAYREVLFLYAIARDLLDREAADTGSVDFLLPMADGTEFGATAPQPYLGLESDAMPLTEIADSPTAPLDLDISGGEARGSLFGKRDEPQDAPPPPPVSSPPRSS